MLLFVLGKNSSRSNQNIIFLYNCNCEQSYILKRIGHYTANWRIDYTQDEVDEIARSIEKSASAFDCDSWAERFCQILSEKSIPFIQNRIMFRPGRDKNKFVHECQITWNSKTSHGNKIGIDTHWFTIVEFDDQPMIYDNQFERIDLGYNSGLLDRFFEGLDITYKANTFDKDKIALLVNNDMILQFSENLRMDKSLPTVHKTGHKFRNHIFQKPDSNKT